MMLSRTCLGYVLITAGVVSCALDDSTWYKRYPAYPEYCSTPEQMQRRAIPPLQENTHVGETRLVHVTSIIRHGARVVDERLKCWKGYLHNAEAFDWDCNLTAILTLPLAAGSDDATFLLEKKYDASPSKNDLKGTCRYGHLVLRGAQQELQNGEHLRDAYTYNGSISNEHEDPRLRLFDMNNDHPPPYQQIHVRSNGIQRTIMSVQLVLKGLFGENLVKYAKQHGRPPVIPLHKSDVMQPYHCTCPRKDKIRHESYEWKERKVYENSDERKTLLKFMKKELGGTDMVDNAMECIMTTICMDRPLPKALDDYGRPQNETLYHKKYGKNLLKRVFESVSEDDLYVMTRLTNFSEFGFRCWFRTLRCGASPGDIMMGHSSRLGWDLCGLRSFVTFSR
jgi:Histidine phosphatase superfamily (branch 2)